MGLVGTGELIFLNGHGDVFWDLTGQGFVTLDCDSSGFKEIVQNQGEICTNCTSSYLY